MNRRMPMLTRTNVDLAAENGRLVKQLARAESDLINEKAARKLAESQRTQKPDGRITHALKAMRERFPLK